MRTFKDTKGREWEVDITATVVDRFERLTDESFFEHAFKGRFKTYLAWRLVYCAVKKQAEERELETYLEWIEDIGKSTIGDLTKVAFDEIGEFFPADDPESEGKPKGGPSPKKK